MASKQGGRSLPEGFQYILGGSISTFYYYIIVKVRKTNGIMCNFSSFRGFTYTPSLQRGSALGVRRGDGFFIRLCIQTI